MDNWLRILLAVFAVYRLAYMISREEGPYYRIWDRGEGDPHIGLFETLRIKLGVYDLGPDGQPEKNLARWVLCPLCVGVWLSAFVVCLVATHTALGDVLLLFFGIAGAQVFLERLGD